jgi:U3 small nucleolar RNA-associated protein 11
MLKNIKKYIPKRKYRERSQLENRKRLGLLEKKSDYKIRAEDYHKKEKRFKKIKEDIRTKNPDEFYFKMANSKIIVYINKLGWRTFQYQR